MQRQVLLCRHAETLDPYPLQPDFERELTKEGVHQAHLTGQWLRENFTKIDAVVASPSVRTRITACILSGRLYYDEEKILYNPDLYNGREAQLINALGNLPENVATVLMVAHNPGITQLARTLTDKHIAYLEPCNALAIVLELDRWEDIHVTTGHLKMHNIQHI